MPSPDPQIPPPQIGALLRMAWEEMGETVFAGILAAGYDDLRPAHLPLLRNVLLEGRRPGELAAKIGLSKQAVNDVLREFEAKGYLTLEPDPHDGRSKRIVPTDRGKALVTVAIECSRDVGRRWAERVGAERYAQFEAVLRDVVATAPSPSATG